MFEIARVNCIENIVEKRTNCSLGVFSPLFHNIRYLSLDFYVKTGTRFSLRDQRLFEVNEVEITRVDCNFDSSSPSTPSPSYFLYTKLLNRVG